MTTGLLIEGGGLRSAFAFGVLKSWCAAAPSFDRTMAVGLSALAASYYRAGQAEALEAAWGDYFDAHGALGRLAALKGEQAVKAKDFLEMALVAKPVDMAAFAKAPGQFDVAMTQSVNGDSVPWSVERVTEEKQLRRFLRAGVAYPGVNEPVQIVERSYYDGALSDPLPVDRMLRLGCDRLVVIQTHRYSDNMSRARLTPSLALAIADVPMLRNAYLFRHLRYNHALKTLHCLQMTGKAIVVAPVVESTELHRYGVSRSAAAEFYSEGLRLGADALARVQKFLEA